jgi:hypothetical protein
MKQTILLNLCLPQARLRFIAPSRETRELESFLGLFYAGVFSFFLFLFADHDLL